MAIFKNEIKQIEAKLELLNSDRFTGQTGERQYNWQTMAASVRIVRHYNGMVIPISEVLLPAKLLVWLDGFIACLYQCNDIAVEKVQKHNENIVVVAPPCTPATSRAQQLNRAVRSTTSKVNVRHIGRRIGRRLTRPHPENI